MKKLGLYTIVFISGAAVLCIEILGTRILGPFYGVSLFLWSALITVTLAALSAGYWVGGRWADRGATISRLCILLAFAGAWLLLVPWLKSPILTLTEPLGLRLAVLLAALILFAPPLTLLGMVSPYAIKLQAVQLAEVGRTAGNLYALSTIASVLSALVTGFFLIPNVGVNRLIWLVGLTLLLTAAIGLLEKMSTRTKIGVTLLLFFAVLALQFMPATYSKPERGLAAVAQSPYAEIRVLDTKEGRHLLIDGGIHTIVDTLQLRSIFPYVAVVEVAQNLFEQPGEMLLIGLGGGSVVNNFSRAGWKVTSVEIDPVITQVAKTFFNLDRTAQVYHMDGRRFLAMQKEKYDLIVLDAFGSSSIPFHLVTTEAFGLAASRLHEQGVLAINIETLGWHHILTRALTATLKQHFSQVLALPIAEPPNRLGNVVLFASNRALELERELERNYENPDYRFGPQYQKVHAWDNRFAPDIQRAPILTDDLNPVDIWSESLNLAARKQLHEYFGEEGLSW